MRCIVSSIITLLMSSLLYAQSTASFSYQQGTVQGRQFISHQTVTVPPHRTCATMPIDSALRMQYPTMGNLQQFEQWLQVTIAQERSASNDVYNLPVVVHVIHGGEPLGSGRNISAAQVQSQLDVLNEDFRRLNADTVNTPAAYQSVAVDSRIEFCPAIVDEQNNVLAEPGINRINSSTAGFTAPPYNTNYIESVIKPATQWDPKKYFNIWVLDIGGSILGYAQFPTQSGLPGVPGSNVANTDGIVVGYRYFGRGNFPQLAPRYNLGRTATHEVGHWLGLRHIWGDGNCTVDDYCNDTPTADAPNYGCSPGSTSCGSRDMVENYMDYSDDACFNLFTQEQAVRMRTVLENSPRRQELRNSVVCNPNVAPVAEFKGVPTSIFTGGLVRFEDLSTGNPNQWNWSFPGGTPAAATVPNPTIRYNTPGTYPVVLQVFNANGNDVITKNGYITVVPAAGCDTLNFPPPGQLTYYTIGGEPLVGWNSQLQDIAKAQLFDNYQPFNYVTGGAFFFAAANKAPNSNATVTFAIWDSTGPGGEPGQILDSVVVDLGIVAQIVDNGSLVQVGFDEVPITGEFYMGFSMQGFVAGDTLGLVSNTSGSSPTGYAWEQWGDGSWHPMDSVYTLNGSPLAISLFASPYVTQSLPEATFRATDSAVCLGETVSFVADAQQPGNSYTWVTPGANPYVSFGDTITVSYDTAGVHPIYLLVNGSCGASDDTLSIDFMEVYPNPFIDTFTVVPASCGQTNGEATAMVTGGTQPYFYEWDANANYQNTPTADSLAPGTYFVFIEDINGCEDFGITTVGTTGGPVGAVANTQDVTCYNGNDGAATVSASQGTAPYTYSWPGGLAGPSQTGLAAGSYIVTITDDRMCDNIVTVVIEQPDSIAPKASASAVSCLGNDGTATVSATGGAGNYTFSWSNGMQGSPIGGLTAGTYTVTVTDGSNCSNSIQVTVGTLPAVAVTSVNAQDAGCGNNDGSATAAASGGDGNFTFNWSNGQSGATISGLAAGSYMVTATDGNGCTAVDSVTVGLVDNLVGTLTPDQAICAGETATLVAGGGLSYTWTPAPATGQGNPTVTVQPTSTTTYQCIVAEGACADTLVTVVTVNPLPNTTIDQGDTIVVCRNDPYTLNASGASTYSWSTGDMGNTITRTAVQTEVIIVTGTSAEGCNATDTIQVTVEDCTGIDEPAWAEGWQLYPNPAQSQLTIDGPSGAVVAVSIYSSTGQLVYKSATPLHQHQINVSTWSSGIYQVALQFEGQLSHRQLTIIR